MKFPIQERFVVSLAVERKDGRTFFVHRNPDLNKEYRGFWSLPTLEIPLTQFTEAVGSRSLQPAILSRLSQGSIDGTTLWEGQLLTTGTRHRTDYILKMAIFTATGSQIPTPKIGKYDKFAYMTPEEMLEANGRKCGTCCSLYFQGLINFGRLSSTYHYLELPPELADSDRSLEEYTPAELWRLAAPNYPLLIRGETGGDGHILRNLILDRFLNSFIDLELTPATRVLDMGCGEGGVLEQIASRTDLVVGLEMVNPLPVRATVAKNVVRGNIYDAPRFFGKGQFDFVILNLMLFWLADLDSAAASISQVLSQNGRVLVTTTPPEFTKNGDWILSGDDFNWVVKKPLRRDRMLTMINRCVGPLWLYPRCTADILSSFGSQGLYCMGAKQLYLDSYLGPEELSHTLEQNPMLKRHQMLPAFTAFTFKKKGDNDTSNKTGRL